MSKGFIPDKLKLSKPLPDNIRGIIAFGGCYDSKTGSESQTFMIAVITYFAKYYNGNDTDEYLISVLE